MAAKPASASIVSSTVAFAAGRSIK